MSTSCFRLVGWGVAGLLLSGCTLIFGIEEGQLGSSGGSGGDGGSATSTGANDAGGAGANGNGGNATGAGGQGGGVGGQGGGGTTCTALDPFDIVTSADVSGSTLDDERIITATRPSDSRVHVAIQVGNNQIAARTVRLSAVVEQSPLVVFPTAADTANRRIAGAYATNNEFRVWGQQDNVAGEFVFEANSDIGNPNVTFVAYPSPTGAQPQCGQLRSLAVYVDDGGIARFAASCFTNGTPQQAIMYGGRTNGAVEWLLGPVALVGGEIPAGMNVRAYAHLGSEHVIIADADDFGVSSPKLRHGADQAALTSVTDITGPPNEAIVFVQGPSTGPAELFVAALHADPDSIFSGNPSGGYATGKLALSQLGVFADDPLLTLGHGFPFDQAEEVAVPFSVYQNGPTFVAGAVSNFDLAAPSRVRLYVWDADGEPLVVGFPVFETATQGQLLTATTAPAGFGSLLSAWTEQTAGVYSLRGARVQCMGN